MTRIVDVTDDTSRALVAADRASRSLGFQVESSRPGYARVSMTVRETMLNFRGSCHGGYIFALADTAFGYACNAYGPPSAGQQCQIVYLHGASAGETLVAEATERNRTARSGLYDVTVRNAHGESIAEFRGYCRVKAGPSTIGAVDA